MGAKSLVRAVCFSVAGALAACAASDTTSGHHEPGDGEGVCVPGHQTSCACGGGVEGTQVCKADGTGLEACDCGGFGVASSSSTGEPPKPCGDKVCADDENCHTCEVDCGVCEPCNIAPSCDNAFVPKPSPPHIDSLDIPKMTELSQADMLARLQAWLVAAGPEMRILAAALDSQEAEGEHPFTTALRQAFAERPAAAAALRRQLGRAGMSSAAEYRAKFPDKKLDLPEPELGDADPPGGTLECGAPKLRVGVAKIKVHEEDDDFSNDIIYCVLQAESMTGAEVRITPKTKSLDQGEEYAFALEAGVFWGQKGPISPAGSMMITYDCIEADTTDGYQNLINSIGMAASNVGDVIQGENGWIFKTAGAIAPVVATGFALDTDDHLFNAQHVVPLDLQLQLTNGGKWSVRREGTHGLSDWDWELSVQAWGCAEYGTL